MSTESNLLSDFLLSRAPLANFLTLEQFTELIPRSSRSHPQVLLLYRELEYQRAVVLDGVAAKIANEAKRGEKLMGEVTASKARRRRRELAKRGGDEREIDMEVQLYGPVSDFDTAKPHTLKSVMREMQDACEDIEDEIADLDAEAESILADLKQTVTELDQLRYQKEVTDEMDPKKQLVNGVLNDLKRIEEACNGKETE